MPAARFPLHRTPPRGARAHARDLRHHVVACRARCFPLAHFTRGQRRRWTTRTVCTRCTACLTLWALTSRTVMRVLSFLFVDVIDEYERGGIRDGRDFLLALERQGRCDETNFRHILQLLRIITRHDLLPYVTLRKRQTGQQPVIRCPSPEVCQPRPKPATPTPNRKRKRAHSVADCREKQTCDIRLRVRAEYCQHDSALQGNVFSNKQEALERQFERFNQANTILKSRDLGSIICDIKFSELTYLDAFWRDYINGSLLEALKGVFITDSLKQAVGHEAIKLLVNVDEEDYQAGRRKLLRNLMMGGGVGPGLGPGSGSAGQGPGTL
ncbi:hypothetical protein HF521_007306 [Silurus meridionalis]|uniref:DED domain-containing protein n=1 Tax=Silurus meridionalis TaxID=175797 RepID=A0A8T0AWE1_SILME|nr:hypothetical protein HF521_007306 [Silurus meridionalis]